MIRGHTFLISCFFVFALTGQLAACSLALHDWRLLLDIRIPLSSPIFPLAEADILQNNIPENATKNVLWVSKHNFISQLSLVFLPMLDLWTARIPWTAVNLTDSVLSMAKSRMSDENISAILGSDKNFFQIAIFFDGNSDNRCVQIVFRQQSRVRGVFPDKSRPWAQEILSHSWVSMIFYQLPFPSRILSISAYPFQGTRASLFEDHGYVERLLSQGKLKRRVDFEIDPYHFDFPDFSE